MLGSRPVCDHCGKLLPFLEEADAVLHVEVNAGGNRITRMRKDGQLGKVLHECSTWKEAAD